MNKNPAVTRGHGIKMILALVSRPVAVVLGTILCVALLLAIGAWSVRSLSVKAHAAQLEFAIENQSRSDRGQAALDQFQSCRNAAIESKKNGATNPASELFNCFVPTAISGKGGLTAPYLLFGSALVDPPSGPDAPTQMKQLDQAYAAAEQDFETSGRKMVKVDWELNKLCTGWPRAGICAKAIPEMMHKNAKGQWVPIERAPLVLSAMVSLDIARWQQQHASEVQTYLSAVENDKTSGNNNAPAAPWVQAGKDSNKLRMAQLNAWAAQMDNHSVPSVKNPVLPTPVKP